MPTSLDSWWSREALHKGGTPVVVKMEDPNWSVLELDNAASAAAAATTAAAAAAGGFDKHRGKNAKQLTWVLLLKAHRAAGCLAWLAHGLWILLAAIKKRLVQKQGIVNSDKPRKGKLHKFITGFLVFAVAMLGFELVAHRSGWHFSAPRLRLPASASGLSLDGLLQGVYLLWIQVRGKYIAPPLQGLANFCIVLFLIQSADRIVLCLGCLWIKYRGIKVAVPDPAAFESGDLEQPGDGFPMVLVQVPMCNEREVYEQSMSAICQLDWPRDRMLIQVLDDSDEPDIQLLIQGEVQRWRHKGVNIVYRHRLFRSGYKAGNLKSAMDCDYVKDYEFVTIFDADFQPKPDFLKLTVPHLKKDPGLALVQARWSFTNKDENLLTRLQNINLSFHFEVEQQVNGVFLSFFGFNGTAGVWRIKALEESGGWLERTTVEDMDIAVRAHLQGWKFLFVNDVRCLCELPESYEAYRKQQHRWHSGPMQLFRLCMPDIITAKIPLWKKGNLIFLFFLLRKLILPFYSFTLFCIILPMTMFVPESHLPVWVICYVPAVMSFLNVLPAPRSFPFLVPYLLFENTMSVTKFNAMVSGLFQLGSAYEWVVTKKTGRSSEADLLAISRPDSVSLGFPSSQQQQQQQQQQHLRGVSESGLDMLAKLEQDKAENRAGKNGGGGGGGGAARTKKRGNRLYRKELTLAFLLLTAAARSLLSAQGVHFYFLLFQGVSFLVIGLDLIGEQVS